MDEHVSITQLTLQVCQKLVQYGCDFGGTFGTTYNSNYKPIEAYWHEKGRKEYSDELMREYLVYLKELQESFSLSWRRYTALRLAAYRVQYFYHYHDIDRVCMEGHSKKRIYSHNEEVLQEFLRYNEALTPKTIKDMESCIRGYISWQEHKGFYSVLDITAHSFSGYLSYATNHYETNSLRNIQLYLRKFHTFLSVEKHLDIPYEFVLSLPIKRPLKISPALSKDDIISTIRQIDRRFPQGKRDYAIVLMGLREGLRAIDIINLKLEDIRWNQNELHIIQQKTKEVLVQPLMPDVAEALKVYITEGRPRVDSPYVFIRLAKPYTKLNNTVAITDLWRTYQTKAGIQRYPNDGKGFHALRRTLGKEMTSAEVPITTTADVLGHYKIESSKQYISIDIKHLKECALDFSFIRGGDEDEKLHQSL